MITYEVKVYDDGTKRWRFNGNLHREGGPAVEYANGSKAWYLNGEFHRQDGPAIERADGTKKWYLNGERLTEEEWRAKVQPSCEGRLIEIDGKTYKLMEVHRE